MALTEEGVKLIVSKMLEEFKGTIMADVRGNLIELKNTIQDSAEAKLGEVLAEHIVSANRLASELKEKSDAVMMEVASAQERCSENVTNLNQTIDEAKAKFKEIERQRLVVQNWSVNIEALLGDKWNELEAKLNAAFSAAHAENQSVKEFVQATEERIQRTGVAGGAGIGADTTNIKTRLNAKDCPVQKLSEKADVPEFRQ